MSSVAIRQNRFVTCYHSKSYPSKSWDQFKIQFLLIFIYFCSGTVITHHGKCYNLKVKFLSSSRSSLSPRDYFDPSLVVKCSMRKICGKLNPNFNDHCQNSGWLSPIATHNCPFTLAFLQPGALLHSMTQSPILHLGLMQPGGELKKYLTNIIVRHRSMRDEK